MIPYSRIARHESLFTIGYSRILIHDKFVRYSNSRIGNRDKLFTTSLSYVILTGGSGPPPAILSSVPLFIPKWGCHPDSVRICSPATIVPLPSSLPETPQIVSGGYSPLVYLAYLLIENSPTWGMPFLRGFQLFWTFLGFSILNKLAYPPA